MTCCPTTEPTRITQGERVEWTRYFSDYPATLWTLQYRFRGPSTGFNIDATVENTTSFNAVIPAATTATMSTANGGKWKWDAYVTEIADSDNVEHLCSGYVQVYAGVADDDLDAVDNRTQAEKNLAMFDEILAADSGLIIEYEKSTPTGSVRVKKSRKDVLAERGYWAGIVQREKSGGALSMSRVRMRG